MVMAASFHNCVLAVRPRQQVKPTTYWVAVLKSHIQPSIDHKEEDFLWIKCHGNITVKIIYDQYTSKYPGDGKINMKYGNQLPRDTCLMRELDDFGDHLIAFEAVKPSETSTRMAGERLPLQLTNDQVFVKSDPDTLNLKNAGLLRLEPPEQTKAIPHHTQDENTKPKVEPGSPAVSQHSFFMGPRQPPSQPKAPAPPRPPSKLSCRSPKISESSNPIAAPRNVEATSTSTRPDWAISNGFLIYADQWREKTRKIKPHLDDAQVHDLLLASWLKLDPHERQSYEESARQRLGHINVKLEPIKADVKMRDILPIDNIGNFPSELENYKQQTFQLQALLQDATTELLESSVQQGVQLLDLLKAPMLDRISGSSDAAQWIQQIDNLRRQAVKTQTIIGVVGNTGAGKSSVINALLDEERIIPTNCMRACTAVVTEISYNDTDTPYLAQIEFIKAADWEKELKTLFDDLLDASGNISRDSSNPDTDAGIAYAKIRAVYPYKTKDDIAKSSIEEMLKEVSNVLGTDREIKEMDPLIFYQKLQHYVDSKEKITGEKDKDKKKERREREFWPLIHVVKIHVKAPALSTGAVIVDLPGVHDSNAARAAVAENYMKQCTGLWIVAPINRAVDDKAAKNLLGESFKRQLKMDGGFSTVTFVCSKTDDISLMEAQESLGLDDVMGESWQRMEEFSKKIRCLENEKKALVETKGLLFEAFNDADEQIEVWDALKDALEDGQTVYPPKATSKTPSSKKRKAGDAHRSRKRPKRDTSDDEFLDDDSDEDISEPEPEEEVEPDEPREPLSEDQITAKISELRSMKKEARRQRAEISERIKFIDIEKREASAAEKEIEAEMSALCISGRNRYSKGAIQQDFAQGIRELDQELAAEEDEDNFNPESDARDYDEVARSLPVFCVSSRGYQKLQGRLRKDPTVPGFKSIEETEIPQLQAHCKQLTEAGRTANCKRFINNLSQLLNSLSLWAANDGTGANMTPEQRRREEKYLQKGLKELESGLETVVSQTCAELAEEFKDNIFDKYEPAIANATYEASTTANSWGLKVNRENRAAGGYHWSTYKAICRRFGEYSNAQGQHQWNHQLLEPMMKILATGWEKTFSRRLPMVMTGFVRRASGLLRDFHHDVEGRARKVGAGIAGLHTLQQQLGVYETILKDLTGALKETINNSQKEINREFTPVVATAMEAAYQACIDEHGTGSYARMKAAMNAHVDQERHVMFQDSADETQKRLEALVRSVEETMGERVDELFLAMRRDYCSVLGGGNEVPGEILPRAQRIMRKEVMGIIKGVENMFKKVMGADVDEEFQRQSRSAKAEDESDGHARVSPERGVSPSLSDASRHGFIAMGGPRANNHPRSGSSDTPNEPIGLKMETSSGRNSSTGEVSGISERAESPQISAKESDEAADVEKHEASLSSEHDASDSEEHGLHSGRDYAGYRRNQGLRMEDSDEEDRYQSSLSDPMAQDDSSSADQQPDSDDASY